MLLLNNLKKNNVLSECEDIPIIDYLDPFYKTDKNEFYNV